MSKCLKYLSIFFLTCWAMGQSANGDDFHCVSSEEIQNEACHNLSFYLNNVSFYFKSNTTFLFLQGRHVFANFGMVKIGNISNLTLVGVKSNSSLTVISCPEGTGSSFAFFNVSGLNIIDIILVRCGACLSPPGRGSSSLLTDNMTILVYGGSSIQLSGVSIVNSSMNAIVALNVQNISILCSDFLATSVTDTICDLSPSLSNANAQKSVDRYSGVCFVNSTAFIENATFRNFARAIYAENDSIIIVRLSRLVGNLRGAEVTRWCSALLVNTTLIGCGNDYYWHDGYGLCASFFSNVTLVHSEWSDLPLATKVVSSSLRVTGCHFESNAEVITASESSKVLIEAGSTFTRNVGISLLLIDSVATVTNASYEDNTRTSVLANNSTVVFTGSVDFRNGINVGNGGALYLWSSTMELKAPATVSFANNTAFVSGGAIYIQPDFMMSSIPCFLKIDDPKGTFSNPGVHLVFERNKALKGGSALYGNINNCKLNYYKKSTFLDIFNRISGYIGNVTNAISSDALRVCICSDGRPSCNGNDTAAPQTVYSYPGQVISLTGLDLYNHVTRTFVVSYTEDYEIRNLTLQCDDHVCYKYVIKPNLDNKTLCLLTESIASYSNILYPFCLKFRVYNCPPGFELDPTSQTCVCSEFLLQAGFHCDIQNRTVLTVVTKWVGEVSGRISLSESCPFDYCLRRRVFVRLNESDGQCDHDRSGVLCGGCRAGLSLVLGSPRCRVCSDYHLLYLVPFALAGMALILLLLLLNVTVAGGTVNGLVFYANVVGINSAIFFSQTRWVSSRILATFVAWINLDLGIETCLFNGMGSVSKLWLNFAFPAYLFGLVGLIVLMARISPLMFKAFGHNIIPVLGTIVLLSFGKFVQLIVMLFSFSVLRFDGYRNDTGQSTELSGDIRLLFDGNVKYLGSAHVPLFILGIILVLCVIPYVILLLSASCLQRRSHLPLFGWVNRLKPFMDGYEAPFKDRYRFWSGALLMVRILLYTLVTLSNQWNNSFDLFATAVVCAGASHFVSTFSIYKNWVCTVVETFYLVNALLLCLAFLYLQAVGNEGTSGDVAILCTVGTAFACFACVFAFHLVSALKRLRKSKVLWKRNVAASPSEQAPLMAKEGLEVNDAGREALMQCCRD